MKKLVLSLSLLFFAFLPAVGFAFDGSQLENISSKVTGEVISGYNSVLYQEYENLYNQNCQENSTIVSTCADAHLYLNTFSTERFKELNPTVYSALENNETISSLEREISNLQSEIFSLLQLLQ